MAQHGVAVIYHDHGKTIFTREAWMRSLRKGDLATVAWLGLLADPIGNVRARRRDLMDTIEEIEGKGAAIWELATGRRSSDKKQRDAMIADAIEGLARQRFDKGFEKPGRPPRFSDPEDRAIIWNEWHSKRNKTNTQAAEAASRRLKRVIGPRLMWEIVADMRDEADEATVLAGGSGRRPGRRSSSLPPIFDQHEPQVYFIKKVGLDQVKIGTTIRLTSRMNYLRAEQGVELELLGCMLGGRDAEARLHQRFSDYRIKGEWYELRGKLAEFVTKLDKPTKPDRLR